LEQRHQISERHKQIKAEIKQTKYNKGKLMDTGMSTAGITINNKLNNKPEQIMCQSTDLG
jgi:hypothetical protein